MAFRKPWVLAALLWPMTVGAQASPPRTNPPTILEAYQRVQHLIAAAVEAHGGAAGLAAARHLRVVYEGWEYHPTQGRRVDPPRDSTWRRNDAMIDLSRRLIVSEQRRGWPGGFHYATRFVTRGDTFMTVYPRSRRYTVNQGWDPPERQYGNLFTVPLWFLIAANESAAPGARRYLGPMRLGATGPSVEAIHFTIPNNGNLVVGLDPVTHQLRASMAVGTDVFTGDTEVFTEYQDWRTHQGVSMPTRVVLRRGGEITSDLRLMNVTPGFAIPDSLLRAPQDFVVAPVAPQRDPVEELAPGVWLVGGGSRAMVVAFRDHLVVVDAPSSTTSEVIRRASTIAPGKPIRYVIPTHHHDDHFLGVRYHAAGGGTTIVTTPGNREYLRRVMSAPMSSLMLTSNQVPPTDRYQSEFIEGDVRVFTDGSRRLELHRIRSPHAEEMLVAWLPAEGILYQADLIEAPADGVALPGANAEATQHLAQVIRDKGWQVRRFVGAHVNLQSTAEFDALARQPLVPPDR